MYAYATTPTVLPFETQTGGLSSPYALRPFGLFSQSNNGRASRSKEDIPIMLASASLSCGSASPAIWLAAGRRAPIRTS